MRSIFSFLKIGDPVVSSLALAVTVGCFFAPADAQAFPVSDRGDGTFSNPVIYADVPDLCVTRAGDTYYMVSTTMHMSPGIPVMKSKDLVNWELASYCYAQIDRSDAFSLKNGKNDYASGSWASNIRYDEKLKRFFVINACNTTNQSYIFSTDNIEKGQWRCDVVDKCYDPGLILDGENRYVFYGQDGHHYRQMFVEPKTYKVTLGPEKFWKKPMSHDGNKNWVEGAHAFKRGDYYYLPVIELRERRVESIWRGKDINDPSSWEARKIFSGDIKDKNGKIVLPSSGVAQGGLVDTPDGKWYALLFQDTGAVGRIPVLIPVEWTADGWPVLGHDGASVDEILPLPGKAQAPKTNIVESDEFNNGPVRHLFSDKELGTGITAGISHSELNQLASASATANLIAGSDFESDTADLWSVNGGEHLAKLGIMRESDGNRVLQVKRRESFIAGPVQNISGKLKPGASYTASVRVKYDDYTDASGQRVVVADDRVIRLTVRNGDAFIVIQDQAVKKGQWTPVSGRFTVPVAADIQHSIFFIESAWGPIGDLSADENKAKHLFDLSIDNVVLVEDALTDRLAANEYGYNGSNLKLQWQWNHNPNNNLWSLTERPGFLRLKSGSISRHIHEARNTLTQRTFGPTSSAETAIEIRNMNDGDVAGLSSYQNQYGFVGVKQQGLKKYLVMQRAEKKDDAFGKVIETLPLDAVRVYLKVDCDFREKTDKAAFYYSLDGKRWTRIGDTLQMVYDWPHFMGYRFGLFYYSTRYLGGCVDFDYFRVSDRIESSN